MAALKIMIVEDEIIVAKDIQRILKKLGYEAFDPFANGKKALDSIEKLNPDILWNSGCRTDSSALSDSVYISYGLFR